MIHLPLALLLAAAASASQTPANSGLGIAERLAKALSGEAGFHDADFIKPLGERDKAVLSAVSTCKVTGVGYTFKSEPGQPDVLVRNPDRVGLTYDCQGVSSETPVGISLHLEGGKVARIETHNFDLMKAH